MDSIEKHLREQGVEQPIETNGYQYRFNHNNLHVEFCVQSGYNANGKFVGEMYRESLSPEEVEQMKRVFTGESLIRIPNPEEWAQNVRKYDHRRFSIGGYLDNIVPEFVDLANMTTDEYIAQRLQESEQFDKMVAQAQRKE